MLTEQTHTEPNWKLFPGTILDGGYEMEELLQADERRARFKIRVLGDRTIDALASVFPVGGNAAQEQIEAWELLRRAPHLNLSKPLATGKRELDGAEFIYVVLRRADETLNAVLGERALTPDEACEVLLQCSRALEHLGRNGLVHGSVSPEEILAVGDSIQLSAEGVRKVDGAAGSGALKSKYAAPESAGGNATGAAAVWSLGATIFETLTQKTCGEGCREQAKQLPVGWILDQCLDPEPSKRCTPEEIPALLKSGPKSAAPLPVAAASDTAVFSSAPVEQAKLASAAVAAAAGANGPAAVVMGASASAPGVTLPANGPASPAAAEAPRPGPTVSSVSQARTKAFKQAEFDALTAPQGVVNGAGLKATAAAALGASPSTPAFGPSGGAAVPRTSTTGAKFETPRIVGSASGVAPRVMSADAPPADGRRTSARGAFDAEPDPQRSRLWMYLAAGAVVLLLMFWALRSKPAKTPVGATPLVQNGATTKPNTVETNSSTAANGKAWPTRTLEPEKPASTVNGKTSGEPVRPVAASKATAAVAGGAVWRVVVYTFNRQEDAEKKARAVNAKHSHLEAQVFSPEGHSAPYLVTIGGRMTREDARRFRSKGLGSGMPRDSYVQNYKP